LIPEDADIWWKRDIATRDTANSPWSVWARVPGRNFTVQECTKVRILRIFIVPGKGAHAAIGPTLRPDDITPSGLEETSTHVVQHAVNFDRGHDWPFPDLFDGEGRVRSAIRMGWSPVPCSGTLLTYTEMLVCHTALKHRERLVETAGAIHNQRAASTHELRLAHHSDKATAQKR
jgi:hypothetical protein